ncbi:hypothetical protein IEQ34_016133 [Dendrobium chrysotoxum]|uniref:Uncharacterized protein n=1 Tax=Dendrobium chrysotoxum TaxID=161865 RepID=A0AAV7GE89_DENCH|nr:hypothetical protein IEQ34_016133 [Dendrobium chrysotoxum]
MSFCFHVNNRLKVKCSFPTGFIEYKMSNLAEADANEQLHADQNEKVEELSDEPETVDHNEQISMPSSQDEEAVIKKKYGGIVPKKPPLISKVKLFLSSSNHCFIFFPFDMFEDHERAFFDSADWALGKQGVKPKGPLEALRPKLQPTPHQQARSRRPAYASADGEEGGNAGSDDANNL